MKVNAEDFRRHYASLPDEELLSMNRDDLIAVARDCYDSELSQRGLTGSTPPPEMDQSDEPAEEPVVVATFVGAAEAGRVRETLRAAGIPCYVENEHVTGMGLLAPSKRGCMVQRPARRT